MRSILEVNVLAEAISAKDKQQQQLILQLILVHYKGAVKI